MVAEYLYAIVPAERELVFDVAGVDDDRDEVRSISYHDIGAVVESHADIARWVFWIA